jgi:hypothetical protein
MVMVKITTFAMTKMPFLSSNGHSRMVKINWYLNSLNQFQHQNIWDCSDGHDQILIDHFDHRNFCILEMVILITQPQFGQMFKKSWSSDPTSLQIR